MKIIKKELMLEARKQLGMSVPMMMVFLLQSIQIITIIFIGHLDQELLLAGTSLGLSVLNVSGFHIMTGISTALDTFCGQAYGAGQYHMVGIYTQRAMLLTTLASIPLSLIWIFLEPILVLMHQDKAIATQAQIFARYSIASLPANGLLRCIIKYFQSQGMVFPMVLANLLTGIIYIILCWALVIHLGFGIKGAGIAICMSDWLNLLFLVLYIKFSSSCQRTWVGLSRESLHNIPEFIKLAFPSTVMLCLEAWTLELMVILSGFLSNPKLETSVLSICINIVDTFWMVPFGVSMAGSTRISHELGAGNSNAAYLAAVVTLLMAFTGGVLESALLMSVWKVWPKAFSNVHEVVSNLISMTPIVAIVVFVDTCQTSLQGVARGCGWQKLGAYVNLASFYLVGVPSSCVMAFVLKMNGRGLFIGLLIALILQVVSFLIITMRANWNKEANNAAIRVGGSGVLQLQNVATE